MAAKLPVVSGREAVKVFTKAGWKFVRQKGSHAILTRPGMKQTLAVPQHKELAKGTLAALVKDAGLTADQFQKFLK